MDDTVRHRDIQRFFNELEQGMREINRQHIHALLPGLTRDNILSLEISVARLRAQYLEAACALDPDATGDAPDPVEVQALREKREAYEEVRRAHEALLYAIERRYVAVAGLKSND